MPILRPRAARYIANVFKFYKLAWRLFRHICVAMFTCGWAWPRAGRFVRFCSSGGAKFTKFLIPCFGRRRTAVQNVTPLALSSAEKSVTVHTQKTVNDTSTPCLSACVDNKVEKKIIRNRKHRWDAAAPTAWTAMRHSCSISALRVRVVVHSGC